MACDKDELIDYLADFGGQNPIDAVVCPFASPEGAGMGLEVFAMFGVGMLGIGLAVRTQHPGPLLVAAILSAGLFAGALPGIVVKMLAIGVLFGIVASGLYMYQKAQSSL